MEDGKYSWILHNNNNNNNNNNNRQELGLMACSDSEFNFLNL